MPAIIELYKRQGRFAATVEPQMVQLDQNRVDVVFEINEGPKSKVRQINIIGNEQFSDGDLRGEMVTKTAGLTEDLQLDAPATTRTGWPTTSSSCARSTCKKGYADFRVVSAVAELTPDKRDFIITYVVEEGPRYKFGDVAVESQLRDFDSDGDDPGAADEGRRLVRRQAGRGHDRAAQRDRRHVRLRVRRRAPGLHAQPRDA